MRIPLIHKITAGLLLASGVAMATPSTTCWTPAATDIQPFGIVHLGVDTYTTVFEKSADGGGDFPADYGLTVGVLPFNRVQMEVGVDLLEPSDDPLFFSAKIGSPEGAWFASSPAMNAGIFNAGTRKDATDQNVAFLLLGKTIPFLGRFHAGPYLGNRSVLVDSSGEPDNKGFMIGYDRGFLPARDPQGNEYKRIVVAADYASGDNAIGGGGIGLSYFFTKDISLLAGPVWFNNTEINGDWKWTVQLDINTPAFAR